MINKTIHYTKYMCRVLLFYIFRIFKIKQKRIFISNYRGNGYGDNAKYIVKHLLDSKLDIWWLIDKEKNIDTDLFPDKINFVTKNSLKEIYIATTSKVWIDNARKDPYYRKRKQQYYLQTWHGAISYKRIEGDAVDKLGRSYLRKAKRDSKMANAIISNGEWSKRLIKEAFWFKGEILNTGSPRCDGLFLDEIKVNEIKQKLGIANKYIVLYAPTFRNSHNLEIYDLDYNILFEELNKVNKNTIILLRLHPNIKQRVTKLPKFVLDVTNYHDMYELLSISNILITDYSSTMFEFLELKRQIYIYAPDYDDYIEERGVYFDKDILPFFISKSTKELIENIKNFNQEEYNYKIKKFKEIVQYKEDGISGKRISTFLLTKLQSNQK